MAAMPALHHDDWDDPAFDGPDYFEDYFDQDDVHPVREEPDWPYCGDCNDRGCRYCDPNWFWAWWWKITGPWHRWRRNRAQRKTTVVYYDEPPF